MLRWLEPENGQPSKKWLADEKLRQQIRLIVETGLTMNRLQNVAVSRTAGIWRIKRSKIILGFLDGLGIEKLVTKVRVPPESIVKCLNRFAQKGLKYFDHPERKPTKREMLVEQRNHFFLVHKCATFFLAGEMFSAPVICLGRRSGSLGSINGSLPSDN